MKYKTDEMDSIKEVKELIKLFKSNYKRCHILVEMLKHYF